MRSSRWRETFKPLRRFVPWASTPAWSSQRSSASTHAISPSTTARVVAAARLAAAGHRLSQMTRPHSFRTNGARARAWIG
jgi:hypothetical protein